MTLTSLLVTLWLLSFCIYLGENLLLQRSTFSTSVYSFTNYTPWIAAGLIIFTVICELVFASFVLQAFLALLLAVILPFFEIKYSSQSKMPVVSPNKIKTKLFYLSVFFFIALGTFIRFYNIDNLPLRVDEAWHIRAAAGYLKTGTFQHCHFFTGTVDGYYRRAWLYTWQIAQAFKFGGINLYAGRLISFFWGMILFLPFYLLTKKLKLSSFEQLLSIGLLALNSHLIVSARWLRFYPMFYVTFLCTAIFAFETIHNSLHNCSATSLILTSVFFLLSWHLHPQATSLLFASLFIYLILETNQRNIISEISKINLILILLLGISGLSLIFHTGDLNFLEILKFPRYINGLYLHFLTDNLLGLTFGSLGLAITVNQGWHNSTDRFFLLVVLIPLPGMFFLFSTKPVPRYVIYLLPVFIPLIVKNIHRWLNLILEERTSLVFITTLLVLIILPTYGLSTDLHSIWRGNDNLLTWPEGRFSNYKDALDYLSKKDASNSLQNSDKNIQVTKGRILKTLAAESLNEALNINHHHF